MTDICFNASEIAALTGMNPYKTQDEAIQDCYNRHARRIGIDAPRCPMFIVNAKRVMKANADAVGDIDAVIKSSATETESSADTETKTAKIEEKIRSMDIADDDKEALRTYARSKMFTNYGTRKESSVHEIYKEIRGCTILTDGCNKFKKMLVPGETFYVGGKTDGYLSDDTVIEIKNRTRRLFERVVEYEYVQVQTYIAVLDAPKAELVECYDDGERKRVLVHDVERDDEFWETRVVPALRGVAEAISQRLLEDKPADPVGDA